MTNTIRCVFAACLMLSVTLGGCDNGSSDSSAATPASDSAAVPVFTLYISEYPSWSAFMAADEAGLLNGKEGKLGSIEKTHNVDIVLKMVDYDTCLTVYGNGKADAVALTNMDALLPAETLPSVVILPTSTSSGADALIVPKSITDVKQLKGKNVYMLAKSVSEYMFYRNLLRLGENPADYKVVNMDPMAAATKMQQNASGYEAIVGWNPFVIDTLAKRPDTHVLFDSTTIPGEIIDSIVASEAALARDGGDRFAEAVVHSYYAINQQLNASATHRQTLMAIGAQFSNIKDPAKMEKVLEQTKFYGTSAQGLQVLGNPSLTQTMTTVNGVYIEFGNLKQAVPVTIGSTPSTSGLRFDSQYIKAVGQKHGL